MTKVRPEGQVGSELGLLSLISWWLPVPPPSLLHSPPLGRSGQFLFRALAEYVVCYGLLSQGLIYLSLFPVSGYELLKGRVHFSFIFISLCNVLGA